jgi:hypothetical protein
MTAAVDDLRLDLEAAFTSAREQLISAQLRQQDKDTPNHRSAVLNCLARIDTVLDLYLDMRGVPAT